MEWIEVTARTVAEAVERSLDMLGVHESELEYEVVEEPKTTLFGLRRSDARIRARVRPVSREKPQDRRRRTSRDRDGGGRGKGEGGRGGKSRGQGGGKSAGDKPDRPEKPERGDTPPKSAAKAVPSGATDDDGDEQSPRTPRKRTRKPRNPNGNPNQDAQPTAPAAAASDQEPEARHAAPPAQRKVEPMQELDIQEFAERSAAFMQGLVGAFGIPAQVTTVVGDESVEVQVLSEDRAELGVLIGGSGSTLHAIEELLRDAVGHLAPGTRLHLDVGEYRARRRAALGEFARKVAEEVLATGEARALEPMTPPDRKVVHDAVAEIGGLVTSSDGMEPNRRVVIRRA